MATIEERAKSHVIRAFADMNDFQAGYMIGAEEQKEIDHEWACKLVEILFRVMKTYDNKEALLKEFKKALDE